MQSYCKSIWFRNTSPLAKPEMVINPETIKYSSNDQFINEYLITGTSDQLISATQILKLANVPKMSTYAIGMIIQELVRQMPVGARYLNIGTWYGYSLFAGMIGNPDKVCIGVDNFSQFGGPHQECVDGFAKFNNGRSRLHVIDYDRYFIETAHEEFKFRNQDGGIGVYFYDGSHDYKSQSHALQMAEPFLNDHAYILVDDINWPEPFKATMDFISTRRNYKIIFHQPTNANEYGQHHTFWNGIILLEKGEKK